MRSVVCPAKDPQHVVPLLRAAQLALRPPLTPPRALSTPAVSGYLSRPARGLKTPCRGHRQEGVKGSCTSG
jgi:hypothetical protein